jgi:hypothetical protein
MPKKRSLENDQEGFNGPPKNKKERLGGVPPGEATATSAGNRGALEAAPRQRRRSLFPVITEAMRCGACHTCLNRALKKACVTRRAEQMAALLQ